MYCFFITNAVFLVQSLLLYTDRRSGNFVVIFQFGNFKTIRIIFNFKRELLFLSTNDIVLQSVRSHAIICDDAGHTMGHRTLTRAKSACAWTFGRILQDIRATGDLTVSDIYYI